MSRAPSLKTNAAPPAPETPAVNRLPDFEPGEQYEITVSRVVELSPNMYARPTSPKIVVNGDKAREIKDAIVTAKKITLLG